MSSSARSYRGSEFQLQRYVVALLQTCGRPGVLWLAIPNGEARSSITGARLKAMGLRPGAADFLVVIHGRAHFLELKTARGRMSAEQKAFEHAVLTAGGNYSVARCPGDVEEILSYWEALRLTSVLTSVARIAKNKPMEERNGTAEIGSTAEVIWSGGGLAASTQGDRHK